MTRDTQELIDIKVSSKFDFCNSSENQTTVSFSATGPTMWALRWSLASFLLRQQVTFPKINFTTLVIPSLVVTWSFEALNSNFSTRIVKFDTYNALWEVYTHSMNYSQTTHIITIITNSRPAVPPGQLSSQQRVRKLRGQLWARLWWRPHSNIQSGGEARVDLHIYTRRRVLLNIINKTK